MKGNRIAAIALLTLLSTVSVALAGSGTIDTTNHYAWNDNGGWVNWYATGGNVTVTDTALTGYIWSAGFGWINLAPTNGGVTNDGHGNLGGYAWGQNTGWISFLGVTIDSNGVFHGRTVAQNIFGTMTFDCTNCDVVSSWRPGSANGGKPGAGGNGPISGPLSYGYWNGSTTQATAQATSSTTLPPTLTPTAPPSKQQPTEKPPSSSKTNAYTSQHAASTKFPPTPAATPATSTSPTSAATNVRQPAQQTQPPAPAVVAPSGPVPSSSCSWFGACLWQSVVNFFSRFF